MTAASVLRAEALRWRGSPPQLLLGLVACFAVVSTALYFGSGLGHSWDTALAWTNIWAVGLGPVFAALLPWAVERMDRRHREGGTRWIPTPPVLTRSSRLLVTVLHLLAANSIAYAVLLAVGALAGLEGDPPLATVVALVLVCTCAQAAVSALTLAVSRWSGPLTGLAAGLVWALSWLPVGTAESAGWQWFPGNWVVRGALPLLGTHANGVSLEPGSALAASSPWTPVLLSVLLAAVLAVVPLPRRSPVGGPRRVREGSGPRRPAQGRVVSAARTGVSDRPRLLAALGMAVGARRFVVPTVLLCLLAVVATRWRPVDQVDELFRLLLLPVAATVTPILVWSALRPAWRTVASGPVRSVRPMSVAAAATWGCVLAGATVTAAVLVPLGGLEPGDAVPALLACGACAGVVVPLVLLAAVRLGTTGAAAIGAVGVLLGLLLGTGPLHDSLWFAAPWGWAGLDGTARIAAAMAVACVVSPVATVAAGRTAARGSVSEPV